VSGADGAPDWAVITGGGRGIGRALALRLGRRGLHVALVARTKGELEATAREIIAAGGAATALPCDVADPGAVDAMREELLRKLGAPHVVVNNAGVVRRALTHELTVEDWDTVVGVNLRATFLVSRAFLPAMLARRGGRFVNVASISSTVGTPRQSAYNAAKWGVIGFTKSLAEELRGTGLQAMAVLPGSVDTTMLAGSGYAPQMTPDAVAGTLEYAALDAPDAMNGSAIEIFGP
jgi:NAD(P)-dependent dehydrogenase (short-subunit alcohol dehydrogenase family)